MSGRLVVMGDALLDRDVLGSVERFAPDAPVPVLDEREQRVRPGGAALAAALAALDDREVTLITALAEDEAGVTLRRAIEQAGVRLISLPVRGTTAEKIRFRHDNRSLMRLDRGHGEITGPAPAAARAAIGWASAVLVSDYGRGVAGVPALRESLTSLPRSSVVVWDPHPRGPAPPPGVRIVTPNDAELRARLARPGGSAAEDVLARARALRERWQSQAICVTRGAEGALLVDGDADPIAVPAPRIEEGDPCGAGDRFASRLAGALADGRSAEDAVADAVAAASAFVRAGGAAAGPTLRATDGRETVVATGGCFDLLHSGHVQTLEAARRMGDRLVVCLNGDESVRRLKGPGRPLVSERDRAAVLTALGCVDEVRIFDEDTPERVLQDIRPDIWVKGGDYVEAELPEDRVVRRWGGRTVILPYVEGRSTTRLIEEAASRG